MTITPKQDSQIFQFIKIFFFAAFLLFVVVNLTGCGGGSSGSPDITITDNTTPDTQATQERIGLSISDIGGFYDLSQFVYNLQGVAHWDEKYMYIYDNGVVQYIDYQQDEFDNGENCYIWAGASLSEITGGGFTWYNADNNYIGVDVEIIHVDNRIQFMIGRWVMMKAWETDYNVDVLSLNNKCT